MVHLRATNQVGSNQQFRLNSNMEEAELSLKDMTSMDLQTKLQNKMLCGHQEPTKSRMLSTETKIKAGTDKPVHKEWLAKIETKLGMCPRSLKTSRVKGLELSEKARRFFSRTTPTKTWLPRTITSSSSRTRSSVDSNPCSLPAEEARQF